MRNANRRVAEALSGQCPVSAEELAGQTHMVKPSVLAPALRAHYQRN